jgi:hypothetical protein
MRGLQKRNQARVTHTRTHTHAYAHAHAHMHGTLRQLVITGACICLNNGATMQSLGCVVDDRDGQRLVGTAPRMGAKQPNEMRRPTALTHSVTGVASAESPARGKPAGASTPCDRRPPTYIGRQLQRLREISSDCSLATVSGRMQSLTGDKDECTNRLHHSQAGPKGDDPGRRRRKG